MYLLLYLFVFHVVLVPVVCVCVFPTKYLKLIQYKLAYKYFNFIIIFGSETFNIYSTHYNLYVIFILRTKG